MSPLVVAHRGTWVGGQPENSAAAFHETSMYAKVLETDARETSDHYPIFSHDPFGSQTYAQMRLKGNAGVTDLVYHLRHAGTYAIVEVKQASYTDAFWTEFNSILGPYKSRIIIYSLTSNSQVLDIRLKYGYQGMYHAPYGTAARPSRAQILAVGTYVWKSPCSYSDGERSGIKFATGLRQTEADFAAARKCDPWAIVTGYAKTAVVSDW